jgi:hypothetical protein
MSIGLVTKSIHTLLILTLELLDEVVETVVIEDLVSTVCDSGDHGLDGEGRFGGALGKLGGCGGCWKGVWVKKRVFGRLWSHLSEGRCIWLK